MKLKCLLLLLLCAAARISCQDAEAVPLSLVFHDMGWNALHSITYNYGLNFAAAGLETAVLIESGGDWLWRGFVYDHYALSQAGLPFTYIGWGAPFAAPLAFYLTEAGRSKTKRRRFAASPRHRQPRRALLFPLRSK